MTLIYRVNSGPTISTVIIILNFSITMIFWSVQPDTEYKTFLSYPRHKETNKFTNVAGVVTSGETVL